MKRLTPSDTLILNDYTAYFIQMFISVTILESESPSSKASVLCRRTYDGVTADLVEKGNERDAEKKKNLSKTYKIFIITSLRFSYNWFYHIPLTYPHFFPNPPSLPHSSTFIAFFFPFKAITDHFVLPEFIWVHDHPRASAYMNSQQFRQQTQELGRLRPVLWNGL